MSALNLTDLRNVRKLKSLLEAGEPIELRDLTTVIAQIVPESAWPEFVAKHRRASGSGATSIQSEAPGENLNRTGASRDDG